MSSAVSICIVLGRATRSPPDLHVLPRALPLLQRHRPVPRVARTQLHANQVRVGERLGKQAVGQVAEARHDERQLVHVRGSREQRLPVEQLGKEAACGVTSDGVRRLSGQHGADKSCSRHMDYAHLVSPRPLLCWQECERLGKQPPS